MGLGYEGWVAIAGNYALGTGASVPRARQRLESSAGYGGTKAGTSTMGIGLPYNYDWDVHDGSLSFEASDFITGLVLDWPFDRQSSKIISFSTRQEGWQLWDKSFFNSIELSSSEGGLVTGSVGFVALSRFVWVYGTDNVADRKLGNRGDLAVGTPLCPIASFPEQLNGDPNLNPTPFWNTTIETSATTGTVDFLTWSLSFSQDVVKFFTCEGNSTVQEPKYLAVGPMTAGFSGSYMFQNTFLGDTLASMDINIGGQGIQLKRLEATTENDEVQPLDSPVPLNVDYAAYEIGTLP